MKKLFPSILLAAAPSDGNGAKPEDILAENASLKKELADLKATQAPARVEAKDHDTRNALNAPTIPVRAKIAIRRHGVDLKAGGQGKVSPHQFDLLKDVLEKVTDKVALIALLLGLCILHSTFCISAQAQIITNLGVGDAVANPGDYGLAPGTYLSGSNACPALAYKGATLPLTNAIPLNSTNVVCGTNSLGGPGSDCILNLTHYDEVVVFTAFNSTNTGQCTNYTFWGASADGNTFTPTNTPFLTLTNIVPAGISNCVATVLIPRTTLGSIGYIQLQAIGVQGTNSVTNFQVLPYVKSRRSG